ncbi:hypothetical protein HanIR_Chr17g0856511 [Helianthus annuus]|nr:hypothetical protein HanIR_Chr17g0856511 [Helianthus annuus]
MKVLLLGCSLGIIEILVLERWCGWSGVVITTRSLLRYRLNILGGIEVASVLELVRVLVLIEVLV